MNNYTQIASRYLKRNKKRTILTIVGIVTAIALFSGISTLLLSHKDNDLEDDKRTFGDYEMSISGIDEAQLDKLTNNAEVLNYGVVREEGIGNIDNFTNTSEIGNHSKLEISAYNKSAYDTIFKTYFLLNAGRLPQQSNEIALESRLLYLLDNKKMGDTIKVTIGDKVNEYKIVGTIRNKGCNSFLGITFLKDSEIKEKGTYAAYLNLKERKNKIKVITSLAKEFNLNSDINSMTNQGNQIEDNVAAINEYLLKSEGILKKDTDIFSSQFALEALIGLVAVCSMLIINNSFNLSVSERIRQFGIIRSIGATPGQIRRIVFKEAFYMCLIAIPIGIAAGYFLLFGILKLVPKLKILGDISLRIRFYPQVILICSVLAFVTIAVSVWLPARKAGKTSPVEAINTVTEIKSERIKKRRTKLLKLAFGFEGELAYKNIRRKPKVFWTTVSVLIVSITLFIVYGTISKYSFKSVELNVANSDSDAFFSNASGGFDSLPEKAIDEIKKLQGVERIDRALYRNFLLITEKKYINKKYMDEKHKGWETDNNLNVNNEFIAANNSTVSFYGDKELEVAKKYLVDGKIDKKALNNMGVLIVQNDFTNYKVGDKFLLPKIKEYTFWRGLTIENRSDYDMKSAAMNNQFYTFTVVGILSKDFLNAKFNYTEGNDEGIGLIFTEDVYKKINGNTECDGIYIKFKDKESREKLFSYLMKKAQQLRCGYFDFYQDSEDNRNYIMMFNLFSYSIIAMITLISVINIINSISINMELRKREFASLKAIGMTKGQLSKMVLLEGLLHGIIASVIGVLLSELLLKFIVEPQNLMIANKSNYDIIAIGAAGAIIITLLSSIIPLNRLNKMNIMDNLRIE